MSKVKVAVVGYGVIGQRLADGVALQKDMELVGIVDAGITLSVMALKEKGMPYDLYAATEAAAEAFKAAGIECKGSIEDLLAKVDIALDSTSRHAHCIGGSERK